MRLPLFPELPSERKTQVGFGLIFVCLLVISVVFYDSVNRLRKDAEWARHAQEVISSLRLMLSHISDAESSQRGFVITGAEHYAATYHQRRTDLTADLRVLRTLITDNTEQQHRLDDVTPIIMERMAGLNAMLVLQRSAGFPAVQMLIQNGEGNRLHDEIWRRGADIEAAEQGFFQERQGRTKSSSIRARVISMGGSVVALIVLAAGLVSVRRDLTRRRKHSAHALLAARLSRLGAWTVELPGMKTTWSDDVCAIHDMPAGTILTIEEAVGFYVPESRCIIMAAFDACMRDGISFDEELQVTTSTGRPIWVRVIGEAERNAGGFIRRMQGALQDITVRKEGVEALRASEARFRELAENIEEVFWISDSGNPRKLYISPAYETIWGRSCRSAYESAERWTETIHAEDRERVLNAMQTKEERGSYDEEYRILRPDGTERWIRDRAYPVRDTAGSLKRWVGVAEDITKYRTMEEQFIHAQKMEALGQFSGGVAHDFNNILATIGGYTELSQIKLTDNPEVREYLGSVMTAVGRAADLVRQILTFSRDQPQERQLIQLGPVITESMKLLRATIPTTIELETELAPHTPTVLANANQIHQILMNLGTNASHAMKDKPGRLKVRLEPCVVDEAHAIAQLRLRPGFYTRISVSDNGSGMEPETLRRLFEPFFTTKTVGEGTGLGLAVVHGIMDSHDGAVTVYSHPGEGTMFHLYFPARDGEAMAVAAVSQEPTPRGQGEHILVVDDEELLAKLGQKTLTALGYKVEIATRPEAALAMVEADPERFALVLTDLTMPGMTGIVLAERVRKIRPGQLIILVTGHGASLTRERVESAGIYQLLLKPASIHTLGTVVHAALTGRPANEHSSHPPY